MVLALAGTRLSSQRRSDGTLEQLAAGLVPNSYAGHDDVTAMADRIRLRVGTSLGSYYVGPAYALRLSPGTVALRTTEVRSLDLGERDDDGEGQGVLFELDRTRRAITEWSRASRARMVRTIAELDYSGWADDGGVLAMVTLTLPGNWEAVAPTGRHFKRFIEMFRRRWIRNVGPWRGLWKLEFQRRGAPHLHALLRVPARVVTREHPDGQIFELWLSQTWAEIVGADDVECHSCGGERGGWCSITCDNSAHEERCTGCVCARPDTERQRHLNAGTGVDFSGVRFSDPRRTAIYFLKHSAKTTDDKEYQHVVPEPWQGQGRGPGRFWGVWGLERATAEVWINLAEFNRARRVLRRLARARAAAGDLARIGATYDAGSPERADALVSMKRPRSPGGFRSGGGWVLVNDGLTTAYDLARWLALVDEPCSCGECGRVQGS